MKKNMEKVNDVKRIDIKKAEELLQSGSLENCDDMLDILLRMPWKASFLTNGSIYREKFAEFLKTGRGAYCSVRP